MISPYSTFVAPNHEFLLPEDIWLELVPSTQTDLWHVIEAEQNPRIRLRVDINRQLSDVIGLVENKWQLAAERLQTLFGLPNARDYRPPRLLVRITPAQTINGAIRLQEVARIRSGDMALRAYLERRRASLPDSAAVNPSTGTTQSNALGIATDSNSGEPTPGWQSDFSKTVKDGSSDVQIESANPLTPTGVISFLQSITSPAPSGPSTSTVATSASSSATAPAELDLRETGKQLLHGVTFEVCLQCCLYSRTVCRAP
ncbi:unnamed protein product [Echinostoma caproni]|uniref:T2SSE_N domain-containing protein n=1 Tax=Echinostoma caproni TaxID=27848 RepID=A0A183B711_9TREM|nr:unnamed protein product [Echinostoma caproni]